MTTNNQHLGIGKRLRLLAAVFCIIMILLPSSFISQAQESEPDEENEAKDWSYYFQLPVALILILILMVAMMYYVRKRE